MGHAGPWLLPFCDGPPVQGACQHGVRSVRGGGREAPYLLELVAQQPDACASGPSSFTLSPGRADVTKRVLVVEGDAAIREALVGLLDLEGYAASVAWTAEDGLRRLALETPDAILYDPHGARLPLSEFTWRYHAQAGRDAPVVVLTTDPRVEHYQAGAAAVVVMPFDADDLLAALAGVAGPLD
jgi:CheY-like chemotaxis protein